MYINPRTFIHDPDHPSWAAHSWLIRDMLGVKSIPPEGMPSRLIQGIRVWVNPLAGAAPTHGKRHTHRVMAECPICKKAMSAGRLRQHAKIHAKE